jgi:hypothetical protein
MLNRKAPPLSRLKNSNFSIFSEGRGGSPKCSTPCETEREICWSRPDGVGSPERERFVLWTPFVPKDARTPNEDCSQAQRLFRVGRRVCDVTRASSYFSFALLRLGFLSGWDRKPPGTTIAGTPIMLTPDGLPFGLELSAGPGRTATYSVGRPHMSKPPGTVVRLYSWTRACYPMPDDLLAVLRFCLLDPSLPRVPA